MKRIGNKKGEEKRIKGSALTQKNVYASAYTHAHTYTPWL